MRSFVIAVALAALAACGAETATTAATSAALKKREIEEGNKTMDRARAKVDEAMEKAQQRAEKDSGK